MFTSGKYLREPLDATYQTPLQRGIDEITQWKLFNYPHQLHGRVEKHLAARRRSSATRASEDIHISIAVRFEYPLKCFLVFWSNHLVADHLEYRKVLHY